MEPVKLKENIYWVGGVDWGLRNFHGYLTQRGSTYNAYLIIDDKITLIDTVKHYLYDEMIERISKIIDPEKIDYLISNHVEMDHSGSIPYLMDKIPEAQIIASTNGVKGLKKHYGDKFNYKQVKRGDSLNIGERELKFVLTPMVHWPDNMVTYNPQDKILFSNDSFGQHIASSERFDTEFPKDIIFKEAKKYYANIVLPYSSQVQKELNSASSLDINIIAPSHGIIFKKHVSEIIEYYKKWSSNKTDKKAVIIYDTMWKSTEKIAYAIGNGFEKSNYNIRMLNLQNNHISDIITEILNSKYICVGSPTLNNNIMPTVASFLTYLKGLAPKNRKGLAFGSYGWGGQSIPIIDKELQNIGFDTLEKIKINYIPSNEELENIENEIADKL